MYICMCEYTLTVTHAHMHFCTRVLTGLVWQKEERTVQPYGTQDSKKEGDITTSKLVPDARTTMTLRDLTSEVEWDRVLYSLLVWSRSLA